MGEPVVDLWWRRGTRQGAIADRFQPPHDRAPAQRRVCPLYEHPTNLLFFDKPGPTTDIWYYELPLPEGKENYTKTAPLQDAEFDECRGLWEKREAGPHSWTVKTADVAVNNYNLDIKNPNRVDDYEHMPPEKLVADIAAKEQRIAEIAAEIAELLKVGT